VIAPIVLFLFSSLVPHPHTWAEEPSPSLSPPLERGISLLKEGRPDEAIAAFQEAISRNPSDPLPHYYSGVAYHLKRQPLPALTALNNALKLEPGMPLALVRIGMIFEDLGRFDQAREAYRAVADRKGDDPMIKEARDRLDRLTVTEHYRKAGRLFQEKRYEESLRELETVLSIDPNHAEARFAYSISLQRLGRFKEAIEAFKKVIEINPENIDALLQLGMTYEVLAAYDEALEVFDKVLALSPDSPQAREARKKREEIEKRRSTRRLFENVAELVRKEKWAEALEENDRILSVEPGNPEALYNKGVILYRLKEVDPAIEAIRQALEVDQRLQKGHYQLGVIYDDTGRYSEALKAYKKAFEIDEETEEGKKAKERIDLLKPILEAEVASKEAKELLEKEDIPGAIRHIESLLSIRPEDPNLYMILASLYLKVERIRDAAASLEKAATLSPKDISIRSLLARLYEGLKEYEKAAEVYRSLALLEEGTPGGEQARAKEKEMSMKHHFSQGRMYMEKRDFEGALVSIQEVLRISPDEPVALFNLGIIYDRLDRLEEAESTLRRAVEVSPDYVQAYLQMGLVRERLRKFAEARESFEKVIDLQKEGREARIARSRITAVKEVETLTGYFQRGVELMEKEDWEGARKEIEAALRFKPDNYAAHYYRGIILDRLGISDEAKEAFKKVIQLNQRFARAYLLLANILIREGEFAEAREVYNDLLSLGEDIPEREEAEAGIRELRALRGSLSINHGFNSNISYGAKANSSFQSSYSLGLYYFLIRNKRGNLSARVSANESIYYKSQNEANSYSLAMDGQLLLRNARFLNGGLSYTWSFFEGEPTSVTGRFSGEARSEPRAIPTTASIRYEFSRVTSFRNKASDSDTHSLNLSMSQKLSLRDNVSGSYTFSTQVNRHILGSNYAKRTHAISIGYSRPIGSWISYNLSYTISLVNYSNPDSTTFFQRFRRNTDQTLGTGFNFRLSERVNLSTNYSYVVSTTNLPVPTREELQRLEDILASPIPLVGGGYRQHNVSLAASVTF